MKWAVECAANSLLALTQYFAKMWTRRKVNSQQPRLPCPSSSRLAASLLESALNLDDFVERASSEDDTVLYLAYGSNLSNETFRGKRGVKPLAQINVQVPSLQVTFDLPGIPYLEPCFANSGLRNTDDHTGQLQSNEKSSLLAPPVKQQGYRKNEWRKGLIGVVYEVTAKDYAHIIATEGGGASYHDILVDCHPFDNDDPQEPVPQDPTAPPFKAHTLFAPALPPGEDPPDDGGRVQRPLKGYAQASARYLKLITDGAAELGLPYEYQSHLQSLRPYRITSMRQRIGQMLLLGLWSPILGALFGLGKILADDKGRLPDWLRKLFGIVFKAVWYSYDNVFKPLFGDGERSLDDDADEGKVGDQFLDADQSGRGGLVGQIPTSEVEKMVLPTQLV